MNCLGEGSKWACADSTIDFVLNKSPESAFSAFAKTAIVMTTANYFIPKSKGHSNQEHFDKQAKILGMISSVVSASLSLYSGGGVKGLAFIAAKVCSKRALVALVSYGTSWKVIKNQ